MRACWRVRWNFLAAVLVMTGVFGGLHGVDLLLLRPDAPASQRSVPPSVHADTSPLSRYLRAAVRMSAPLVCEGDPEVRGDIVCGVTPPSRRLEGATAYLVTTVAAESFWAILPDDFAPIRAVLALPDAPIEWFGGLTRSTTHLTTALPETAALRFCGSVPSCEPEAVASRSLSNGGILTRWRLGWGETSSQAVTIEMGIWVLALPDEVPPVMDFLAGTLRWSLRDHFLLLRSSDVNYPIHDDWAGVRLLVAMDEGTFSLRILPGCELSEKRPDLDLRDVGPRLRRSGPSERGGEWCVGGRYWVHARNIGGSRLDRLHDSLRILSSLEQA